MSKHLLPCSCGHGSVVSTAQAGQTMRCPCGATLNVPTLRELRDLPIADDATDKNARPGEWQDRHRRAFVFVLAALGAFGLASYLWGRFPEAVEPPTLGQVEEWMARQPPAVLFDLFARLEQGNLPGPDLKFNAAKRRLMTWAIGGAVAVGLVGVTGAVLSLRRWKA